MTTDINETLELRPASTHSADDIEGGYLSFHKMITPALIQLLFWIYVVICVLVACGYFYQASQVRRGGEFLTLIGLAILILGPFAVRMFCELAIVQFRIHSALEDIRRLLASKQ